MSKEKNSVTLKVFALVIAIVLWSYVMSEVNPVEARDYRNISVTFNNEESLDREGLMVMEPKEVTITVEVSGKRSEWKDFEIGSIKANLDLSGYGEGDIKVPIKVDLDQDSKIKVTNWEPKEVLFTFDRLITREKEVTIKTEGQLEDGYILGDLETKSESILLKGPRSWINEISEVVATVDLNGRKADGNITVPIKLLDDQENDVRGVEKEPSSIDIKVPILRTVKVPIDLQIENQLPENYDITEVSINPSNIGIKGNKDILKLVSIQTKPVDISNLRADTDMTVELEIPEGVKLLDSSERVRVSLKIEKSDFKTFSYKLDELRIENLDKELYIDEDEFLKDIEITVKGNKESIEKLTKEDLDLYLDLNTLEEGLNQVSLNFDLPPGMTIKEIKPEPVEILLIKN